MAYISPFCLFFTLVVPLVSHAFWWDSEDYYHGFMQKPVIELAQLLPEKKVLFIDTREKEEYEEGHIPFAHHMQIKDIDNADLQALAGYEWVVPYCVKDFRAFEVARSLIKKGLKNVILMDPSGLKGWKAQGFTVVRHNQTDIEGLQQVIDHLKIKKEQ